MRPVFVFDSECPFCTFWAKRWERQLSPAVEYLSIQEAAKRFRIPEDELQTTPHFFIGANLYSTGAHAVILMLSYKKGSPWLWISEHIPGSSTFFEWVYQKVASCPVCAMKFTRMFFQAK